MACCRLFGHVVKTASTVLRGRPDLDTTMSGVVAESCRSTLRLPFLMQSIDFRLLRLHLPVAAKGMLIDLFSQLRIRSAVHWRFRACHSSTLSQRVHDFEFGSSIDQCQSVDETHSFGRWATISGPLADAIELKQGIVIERLQASFDVPA